MKFSWKGLLITVGLGILIFSHILIGLYVYANITDWKINFLNINPSEPSNERDFPVMTYPPSNGSGFQIGNEANTILFENIYLKYNGIATENQPLELSVVGTLYPSFAAEIDSVSFYFDGALPYPLTSGETFTGSWGITLYPTIENQNGVSISFGAFLVGNPTAITWQVQGNYYPSITINFKNVTSITQSYVGDQNFAMQIASAGVIKQQNSSRVNTSVAIALVFFAFVDGSVLVGRFLLSGKKKRQRKPKPNNLGKTIDDSKQQPTNKPESKPNKNQPVRKKKRNKSQQ